ncbi:hypothetical protein L2750_05665 [Shewanella submarina]|uniref:YcxB-like protein domain-containing protein n=1 Tax=Shewanella submarina TaxID=2016376 RepID=A0ABV7GCJ1_9GAMM|nr:hypothetical protein [Shewanella submarina]MCL1036639.1 hypothetical protein [Shewanella submarina]
MNSEQLIIKPRVNRVAFYTAVPCLIFFLVLNIYYQPELSGGELTGLMFLLCIIMATLFLKALLAPWLAKITFTEKHVFEVTRFGGVKQIDYEDICVEECFMDKRGLYLSSSCGEPIFIPSKLFSKEDIEQAYRHLTKYIH